jgi:hypothetical protein
MAKVLNGIHITVFCILLLSAARDAVFLVVKFLSPSSELVRYWMPGTSYVTIPVSLAILAAILAYSTGLLKPFSLRSLIALSTVWLVCLTWVGWFTIDPWFRRYDLDGVDWNNAASMDRAMLPQLIWHIAIYLFIVGASLVPVVLRLRESRRTNSGLAV